MRAAVTVPLTRSQGNRCEAHIDHIRLVSRVGLVDVLQVAGVACHPRIIKPLFETPDEFVCCVARHNVVWAILLLSRRPAGPDVARAVGRDGLDHHPPGAVAGWNRYGAPSAARTPEGEGYIASFEGPGGAYSVAASSKREAYRLARREWVRRLLG